MRADSSGVSFWGHIYFWQVIFLANEVEIAIIGGGVVGCAVAWELSGHYNDIFLFEKNPGITRGENQSSRNSGVIHSGIYYDPVSYTHLRAHET